MTFVNELILSLASSPLVLIAVLLVVVIDGFFPPVPNESVVVALAAIAVTTRLPNPWLVIVTAALGSFLGDNIAYHHTSAGVSELHGSGGCAHPESPSYSTRQE